MNRLASILLFAAALVLVRSSPVRADVTPVTSTRIALVGGGSFGGSAELRIEDSPLGDFIDDMDPGGSGVVGLQLEAPVLSYFTVIGRFSATRFDVDPNGDDRNTFLDFGVAPTATVGITAGKLRIEPRLGMPVGFSLHVANSDANDALEAAGVSRTNAGWHLGVLAGAHLSANSPNNISRFGGFFELGFMHHAAYASGNGDTSYRLTLNQFTMQVGLTFAL